MNWREVITADPNVVHGQVRFAGTRIPVSVVLDCLASGMSEAEIVREYPTLPARAVRSRTRRRLLTSSAASSDTSTWMRWGGCTVIVLPDRVRIRRPD